MTEKILTNEKRQEKPKQSIQQSISEQQRQVNYPFSWALLLAMLVV